MNLSYLNIIIALFIFTANISNLCSQNIDSVKRVNIIGFTPSKATTINGLALGPFESFFKAEKQQVNGVSVFFIGQGALCLMTMGYDPMHLNKKLHTNSSDSISNELKSYYDTTSWNFKNNGIVISVTGLISDQVNGLLIGGLISNIGNLNGVSLNILINYIGEMNGISIGIINLSHITKGLQIGLFNKTYNLKGIQIGLWNKNKKRSTPFINW